MSLIQVQVIDSWGSDLGGALSPVTGPGQGPSGGQGAKSPKALRILSFTQLKIVLKMHFLEPFLCLEII